MKTLLASFISAAFVLSLQGTALAKTKKPAPPPPPEDISINVPQSQLSLPTTEKPESSASNNFVRLQMSNWSASHLTEESQVTNSSGFSTTMPEVSLQFGSKLKEMSWATLSSVLGGSFLQMQRSGDLGYENTSIHVSQNINMYQANIGLELLGTHELLKNLRPFGSMALAPTWSQSVASEFNNGVSELDWLVKSQLGLSLNSPKTAKWLGIQEAALEFGLENSVGLNNSAMADTAVWAGARLGWK